jgi:pimeloyl-ACP methyl ester carboxylesterase
MFKTRAGQARYFAAYDAALAVWPVSVESLDVHTRFGDTHVNACGRVGAPPLVLLPGIAISSTMWYANVADLSRNLRVYAVDTIGDKGKSVCTRSLRTRADFADWMRDLFTGLRLQRAHIAGLSYGGFLALDFTLSAPECVTKLILLAPAACLLPFTPRFYLRFLAATVLPGRLLPVSVRRWLCALPAGSGARPVVDQFLVATDFRGDYNVSPRVYGDAELRRIAAPTLVLIGEREVIYDPRAALRRAADLIPDCQAALVPGAGHAVAIDQPEIVNDRILEFLREENGLSA